MAGYWDLVKLQPAMVNAGVNMGNAFASAFANTKARELQERQMQGQEEAAQRDLEAAQAKAVSDQKFNFLLGAHQRAETPELKDSAMRTMQREFPEQALAYQKQINDLTQQQQEIGAFGQPKPLSPTTLARNLEEAGFEKGTPEYQAEMRRLMDKKAAGVSVNIGEGKPLGEATVRDLSSIDAAIASVKSLNKVWDQNYSDNDALDVATNWIKKHAPAGMTPESLYEMRKTIVTQNLGRMLEGGVLREPDFKRYVAMIPGSDMVGEAGEQMWGDLIRELESLTTSKETRLKASGYAVPGGSSSSGGAQEDFTQMSDEELQRIVRGK